MRDDVAIAVGVFLVIMVMFALLAYVGYDRWEAPPLP